ncbi:hypothetical protein RHMOL_Rhmol13G0284200 [Rhododendron molle]|uniref:Uncharacterized protein n=4 Tax=Rhododendron molle TaxID=49168 RepID=A0ACC0LBK7_RHOML|nr:hypothetical protein RHMOL_Rhmol13G0284200 [Rhododendron molle]KAI8526120.1 hypothetical protein RHMOL_Rhmol13G0284200 [Rhododendron molle]KAI8526121.1 hypothetical protein RHMOL_Rhmol13G0284200 [Rhododendron molle]KAI8526122.1 hypothetical protein RHMOL_Rhmol13G0284200 [Rhododendron molle]
MAAALCSNLYRPSLLLLPLLLSCLSFSFVFSDDGATLLEIKKSFRDVDNVLFDWTDLPSSDYCAWRGVACDNVTFNVVSLNLSSLNLDGEISPAIGELRSLQSIDLRENSLSGQIPDEIGDCSSLKYLDLSFNALSGDIPFSVSKLKDLEFLILKNNQLIGPIPSTLSQIPNLKILDLAQNSLSGEIPRLIYWNEVLQYLDVRNNSLIGSIPQNVGNCTAFQVLDLSYNQLTGEIPFNIGFLQVATLSLQGNQLSGQIPSVIGLMQALAVLDLSCNMLSGPIPPILGNLTFTEKLYLHSNKLSGPIPPELGNMTKLHYLELNDNQLTGHIPPELGKLTDLFDLNVANNLLDGPIPDNLSSCTNLNSLNVYGNKLNGTIPLAFERLESMTYLNLSSNNLRGPIPVELSRIGNLDTLDISHNRLTGSIPSSLGDLEHLLKMNLSKNNLVGFIPAEFGNLRSVMDIDLSSNQLSGQIPQELGQLQNLLLLRVENNNLSGDVTSLMSCISLMVLNVSYNNLVGSIPTGNNFSRFSPDSFIGNPELCGYRLGSCDAPRPTERVTISKAAILGIAVSALVILLMILVTVSRPTNSVPFPEGSLDKPVSYSSPKLVILHMNMALHVYEDIMRMTENLSEKYIIGYGASSTVYKCVLKNCRPVAIKRLYSQYPQCLKEFETELETVGSIKHRNLVSLQGYSLSPSGNLLFYDYMENGSLWDLLHGPTKKKKLDWDTRIRIALGAAQGLSYLHHDCSPRIIHRDILSKTANNAVMDTVDSEISATCKDLGEVKMLFQLALLCTKRQPSDRPTMNEVSRILGSLIPSDPPKQPGMALPAPLASAKVTTCYMDEYANFKTPQLVNCPSMSTSDAQLFLKFGEGGNDDVGIGQVKLSPDVSEALSHGRAVVALESTIISHGMPYPQNLETAKEVEAIVRENGAVPATVAILDGVPCVGLSAEELERLAIMGTKARKTARRDIAYVVATRLNGATTVSATMIFASMVGIHVFVTGGIGGVHRHGENTMDISSDLTELGRTPIAVISAGVKSILDIPRTLEYLETQGVCVAAYQTDEFPAFFTETSGCKAPCRIDTPEDSARLMGKWQSIQFILIANMKLKLGTGILIAVPIPKEHSASGSLIESAIQKALIEARDKGITGNAETPFLLARVNELTGGASLSSNIALVKNNALVGAKIAVCLAQMGEDDRRGDTNSKS